MTVSVSFARPSWPHLAATPFIALLLTGNAVADAPLPDNQWHGNVVIGGTYSSGNTSSATVSATAEGTKASATDKVNVSALVNYGSTDTTNSGRTTTADQAWLRGRYDYNLSQTVFTFGGAEAETNKLGGIDSRYGLSAGAGYWLLRNDINSFDLFAGVGYADVNYTDDSSANGFELLFGEESEHRLGAGTTLKQRFAVRPGQGELGTHATFDAALATTIVGSWTLNLGLNVQYNSDVPPGLKTTDTLLTAGFGYKF